MGAIVNSYTVLQDVKDTLNPNGLGVNAPDDAILEDMIAQASRAIELFTLGRTFYPRIETRAFDSPLGRGIKFDDDLLEIISLLNGDGSTMLSSSYRLFPANWYPKSAVALRETAGIVWLLDSTGNQVQVISLSAVWGWHDRYASLAWENATTLNGNIDSVTTTVTLAAGGGAKFDAASTLKIDSEFFRVESIATDVLTVTRGINGSTAAAHTSGATAWRWHVADVIESCCREIVLDANRKRSGQLGENAAVQVTGAGVVIRPQGFPKEVKDKLWALRRI